MLSDQRTLGLLGSSPRHREGSNRRGNRGTVLLLFPAALLAMVVLGAVAIDVGYTTVRGRELRAVAASAANDSLAALDITTLRTTGATTINESDAHQIVTEAVALGPLPDARVIDVDINGFEIAVTLELDIELVMAPALGNLKRVTLQRTARAVVLR